MGSIGLINLVGLTVFTWVCSHGGGPLVVLMVEEEELEEILDHQVAVVTCQGTLPYVGLWYSVLVIGTEYIILYLPRTIP